MSRRPLQDDQWPDSHHPALERYAETIRGWLNTAPDHTFIVPMLRPIRVHPEPEPDSYEPFLNELRFTRHRARGPAPYVGRPFHYRWDIATDPYGRSVGGSARIQYTDGQP